ncbi:MAG: hypothetical protein LBI91_05755, partial [Spirochaetaceae bacterium]|nr:hypothetical protein [Spirochaetaceae bacterium]
ITIHSSAQGTKFDYCDISGGGRASGYSANNCLFIWNGAWAEIRNTAFSKSNYYYVGFDDDNATTGYHIYSDNVSFDPKGNTDLLANVWYEVSNYPTANALPANNFTPNTN